MSSGLQCDLAFGEPQFESWLIHQVGPPETSELTW